jgi:Domain of unknown function (DUF4253)
MSAAFSRVIPWYQSDVAIKLARRPDRLQPCQLSVEAAPSTSGVRPRACNNAAFGALTNWAVGSPGGRAKGHNVMRWSVTREGERMATGSVPEDGVLQLGAITLPAGKRVHAGWQAPVPVAWATSEAVPQPGRVWAALSAARQQTGLVPFLLGHLLGEPERPWDTEEFEPPVDPGVLDQMDAAEVLADRWDGEMPSDEELEEDEEWAEMIAPFDAQFPGPAPPEHTTLSPDRLDEVLGSLPAARIGLAPAARPADVLPLIGWTPSDQSDALPVAAVVRSWEDRFGARLLRVGFAEFSLLVDRPPRTIEHAQRIAAEHFAFCDECAGKGLSDIPSIAANLMQTPIWTFWWD